MVYVLNQNGQPLMPTRRYGKVRRMLTSGRAKVIRRCPFTIQLSYGTTNYTQPVVLGVDTGYKHIGLCATTEAETLYAAEVEERTDIVNLYKARREQRRSRRNRKTRYRKARFDNRIRSRHKGWLAPSIEHKIGTHISAIKKTMGILPISKIRIETAEFDIHKLKNPDVEGIDYQQGEKYGHYNTRNYVLWRDSHTCRCCGCKTGYLYVVSADGSVTEGPEDLYTVCQSCLDAHLKGIKPFGFHRKRYFAPPTQMGIMRDTLLKRLREAADVPVEQTFGYVTKGIRDEYGAQKNHINDAWCIAGNLNASRPEEYFYQKKIRRHNRQLHKLTIGKGGCRKLNQAAFEVKGFRLFDKVLYKGQECFLFARRTSGYMDLRLADGTKVSPSASYKKIRLLEHANGYLAERRLVG